MTALLNSAGGIWSTYFGAALVQNTLFLGILLLILNRARALPARVRHVLAVTGLVKLLIPPLFPATVSISETPALQPLNDVFVSFTFTEDLARGAAPLTPDPHLSLASLLFVVWAAIALLHLGAFFASTLRLARRLRPARRVPTTMEAAFGPGSPIALYRSDEIPLPLTLFLYPQRIFVPATWEGWSEGCRLVVLRHELAHLERRDGIIQALQSLAHALYFFHPLVWLLNRHLNESREMACDDHAVAEGECSPRVYSRHLVNVAETLTRRSLGCEPASTLIRRRNELLNRVRYQMNRERRKPTSRRRTVSSFAVLSLLAVSLSWYAEGAASGSAAPAAEPATDGGACTTIHVLDDSEFVIDGEPLDRGELADRLSALAGDDPHAVVVSIACREDVAMQTIFALHEMLTSRRLTKVNYINAGGAGVPLVLPPARIREKLVEIPRDLLAHLRVDADGKTALDGDAIDSEFIRETIRRRISVQPQLIVSIETERQTRYRIFVEILEAVKKAKAKRIAVPPPRAE